jgi:hypothetical protein
VESSLLVDGNEQFVPQTFVHEARCEQLVQLLHGRITLEELAHGVKVVDSCLVQQARLEVGRAARQVRKRRQVHRHIFGKHLPLGEPFHDHRHIREIQVPVFNKIENSGDKMYDEYTSCITGAVLSSLKQVHVNVRLQQTTRCFENAFVIAVDVALDAHGFVQVACLYRLLQTLLVVHVPQALEVFHGVLVGKLDVACRIQYSVAVGFDAVSACRMCLVGNGSHRPIHGLGAGEQVAIVPANQLRAQWHSANLM